MPIKFQLNERLAGFSLNTAASGQQVQVLYRELVSPTDSLHLQNRLDQIHGCLFSKIPGLPPPSLIDHLLVVIDKDLSGIAYVNELKIISKVRVNRTVEAGAPIYAGDISDISSLDLGVEIPIDAGVVLVRSLGWKCSLFFDFGPLLPDLGPRSYSLDSALAQQALLLLGFPPSSSAYSEGGLSITQVDHMAQGLENLRQLLDERCQDESTYQKLLENHPWMLGGLYVEVMRHATLDDRSIPDFTAVRCYDRFHDIIELKQPFLKIFRKSGGFTAAFNDAWNQAERYLAFANRQRQYLRDEKELMFENPRCLLMIGYNLSEAELREIRCKEVFSRSLSIITYDNVLETAQHIISLVQNAGERIVLGAEQEIG